MPALNDVARLAGVSKATASRALTGRGYVSDGTRRRVEAAAAEIGYVASPAAASLVTGRTKNVGVVIPFVNRWYFGEVLEGIERALIAAGYDLTLYNVADSGPERDRVFDFFLARKRVDAVIAIGIDLDERETDRLRLRDKPVVVLGGDPVGATVPTLAIDDRAAAVFATEHLLRLGHRSLAHLAGSGADASPRSVPGRRRRGFVQAVEAAGIGIRPQAMILETEMTLPGGFEAGLQLLGHPHHRPTAVFAACDEIAFGLMLAAERLGVTVPAELSVVGIDGHDYAEMFRLTTVEQRPGEHGAQAVELVMRMLGESPVPLDQAPVPGILPVRFVVRSSTTAPPPSPA